MRELSNDDCMKIIFINTKYNLDNALISFKFSSMCLRFMPHFVPLFSPIYCQHSQIKGSFC